MSFACEAQDTLINPGTRQEVWPEIDFYYRINERFRLFASYSASKLKTSSYTDGGLSAYLDYFAFPVGRKMKTGTDSIRGRLLPILNILSISKQALRTGSD